MDQIASSTNRKSIAISFVAVKDTSDSSNSVGILMSQDATDGAPVEISPGTAITTLTARDDLQAYGANAIALYALELRFGLDDIETVADEALTDDTKDRCCDLLYVDRDNGIAVIAQAYASSDLSKSEPPAGKAADLNTALTWVLGDGSPEHLGEKLRSAAASLQDAIGAGDVAAIEVWYVHNLATSKNVETELRQVETTAAALLSRQFPDQEVEVKTLQVSSDRLDAWYRSVSSAILVTEKIALNTSGHFKEQGDGWEAICASVPAAWLRQLYETHGDELFSANVRGPIPSRRSRHNINFAIGETAKQHPHRFWAYNNGITALVNDVRIDDEGHLEIIGIAIVNGAQTTGALARVPAADLSDAQVLARFVKSRSREVIDDIIRYNNSQNPIKPSDYRSRDQHQERLRSEFKIIPDVLYLGARRGGSGDAAKKPSNYISSDTAAQSIAAVHQDPITAYHDLRLIWERDETYARYFSDSTTAAHIVFCFSLVRAIQDWKVRLAAKGDDEIIDAERTVLSFLRKRGSTLLLAAAISASLDTVLGRPISSHFRLSFGTQVSPAVAIEDWTALVESLGSFAGQLDVAESATAVRRNETAVDRITAFKQTVAAVRVALAPVFDTFKIHVIET